MPRLLRAEAPDREARAFLRLFNLLSRRAIGSYSLSELRQLWRLVALALGRRTPVASVVGRRLDGPTAPVDLRIFTPEGCGEPSPAFLWRHGGGFMVGGHDTADAICRNIARASGCIAVSVSYRLAPEHDLTAGREDFLAALHWVATNAASLGIDADRLAVGGDSAGGNIAAAVALENARRGGPKLAMQVLAYPATELTQAFPSKAENAAGYLISAHMLDWISGKVASTLEATDPWLSPARDADLRSAAPALIISAGYDPIRDDGLNYARRLREAGVPVELLHYAGQFHGFLNFDSILAAGRDALDRAGRALSAAFNGDALIDRTIEIADEPQGAGTLVETAADVAAMALMTSRSVTQWTAALTRLALPEIGNLFAQALRLSLAPVNVLNREASAPLGRLAARQTYPAASVDAPNSRLTAR
jgi:acetyl esterase